MSPETPEWKQRLSNTRRAQPMVIPRGPPDDPADQVPSFMKEFEKKKRTFPRGLFLKDSGKMLNLVKKSLYPNSCPCIYFFCMPASKWPANTFLHTQKRIITC